MNERSRPEQLPQHRPRFVVAGTGSGSGKTTVTLGLLRAFARRGLTVQAFKCGPDYIDPAYHAAVTGRTARNLDSWMTSGGYMLEYFLRSSEAADLSVIEGVMGLYDGKEATALTGSTAEIALLTGSPVLLVVDVRSMGRSAAAIVLGFQQLEPGLRIAAVIVNRCGSASHYRTVKASIEAACGIPVIGWLARDEGLDIPERHLGLLPAVERGELEPLFDRAADLLEAGTDLDVLLQIAAAASVLHYPAAGEILPVEGSTEENPSESDPAARKHLQETGGQDAQEPPGVLPAAAHYPAAAAKILQETGGQDAQEPPGVLPAAAAHYPVAAAKKAGNIQCYPPLDNAAPQAFASVNDPAPVIAVAQDAAFNFYYADNLELLARAGARLALFSPLSGEGIPPEADGIYLGGGFPEEFAATIAGNSAFLLGLRAAAAAGMPLYAECGGYMVLARSLTDRAGAVHEMAGIIPAHTVMQDRRTALGYREVTARADCLLLKQGERLRGHEFHYSLMSYSPGEPRLYAYDSSGRSGSQPEGYAQGNVMAAYAHIHLASHIPAAIRLVEACRSYHGSNKDMLCT
ncbi:cobyrinate a,c-diamide synthase [Paenibacillus jilunlii]|uniref:Cobyrinate a,c-diamide synthase n=1 Tax=Paenibacillus jilunlii TaxID=682956 RepID=A0A1G9Q4D5_9BACL|nr:cobyrinate a,c-diamide synthase [Paenibacillus jilunlii]KWX73199.1 cobyrinic acid a,c-diamide synthase [Paenibacillus jilunlii]SDM05205.1 cobyrinic acid a,c-diamide synthase [Paenibacillus jilunlii]